MRMVQLPLPELAPSRPRPARHRSRSHVRVWSDPAVLQAEADAGHRFEDWRRALVAFLRRLPVERRAELRSRIGSSTPGGRPTLSKAA